MAWYHGTSSILNISSVLLPPIESGFLREELRAGLRDVVFVTNSLVSAEKYARKASTNLGGDPIILTVIPIGDYWYKGNGDFICYKAKVLTRRTV